MKAGYFDRKEVGSRLRLLRKQMDVSREYVAEKLNCSAKHIQNVETGTTGPSVEMLMAFSRFYHISIDELLRQDTEDEKPTDDALLLTALLNTLTARERKRALAIINTFAHTSFDIEE